MTKITLDAGAPVRIPIQFTRGERTTLAVWIGRQNLMQYPSRISAALEGDSAVKTLLDGIAHTASSGQLQARNVIGFQLGKQLRPIMKSMSPREAVQTLCFLSGLSLSATVKGWIIRGVFEARGNGWEVAEAFVAHYQYSDQRPFEPDCEDQLPGPRTELLNVFLNDSGEALTENLIGLRMVSPAIRNAKTPDQLLAIFYAIK